MSLHNAMVLGSESAAVVRTGFNSTMPGHHINRLHLGSVNSRSGIAAGSVAPELIRRHPALRTLTEQDQYMLLSTAKIRNLKRREPVWHQGDHASTVILVLEGYLKVWAPLTDGGEALLEIAGPGECTGEISILEEAPREASLTALSCCRIAAMDASHFRQLIHRQPDALAAIMRRTAERLRQARQQLLDNRTLTVRARLAKALLSLTKLPAFGAGGSDCLPVRLSQSELGAMAGVCREIVNKCLGEWRDAGWIAMSAGTVTYFDVDKISAIPREEELDDTQVAWEERRGHPRPLMLARKYG